MTALPFHYVDFDQAANTMVSTRSSVPHAIRSKPAVHDGGEIPPAKKRKSFNGSSYPVRVRQGEKQDISESENGDGLGTKPEKARSEIVMTEHQKQSTQQKQPVAASDNLAAFSPKAAPKLRRFGSEEALCTPVEPVASARSNSIRSSDFPDVSDGDSEEAPEEYTVGEGKGDIEAAAHDAARVSAQTKASQKLKRSKHERKMREQARTVEKLPSAATTSIIKGTDHPKKVEQETPSTRSLPALLPDYILNAEPPSQTPMQLAPLATNIDKNVKRKRILDDSDKIPKDVVRGNTRIRLLPVPNSLLPPKSSSKGRDIRERWLLGQRGSDAAKWLPRTKPLSGFVRKSR